MGSKLRHIGGLAGGLVAALLVAVIALGAATGCSWLGEPSSTENLLVRYAANKDNDNFVLDGRADLSLAVSGLRTNLPITAHFEVAGQAARGTVAIDLSALGDGFGMVGFDIRGEMVGHDIIWYVRKQGSTGLWSSSQVNTSFSIDIPLIVDVLSSSRFVRVAYDTDERVCYELTMPAASLLDAVMGMGDITTSFGALDQEALDAALGESKVHVCFTKDCLACAVSCDLAFTYQDERIPVPVTVYLNLEGNIDQYGHVDPASAAVDDDVRNNTFIADDPLNVDGISDQVLGNLR